MMLRLGERRHGDNADTEGVTQEAVANMIDTIGKGFPRHDARVCPVSRPHAHVDVLSFNRSHFF